MASDKRAARLGVLALVGMLLFGALGARLWFLQTVESSALQQEVNSDRTKVLLIPPQRGQIFDSTGRLLAGNERTINVTVSWDVLKNNTLRAAVFSRLSGRVGVSVEEMEKRYDTGAYSTLRPLPVAFDVSEPTIQAIEERAEDLPGVGWEYAYRRVYPYAPLASHVVGYMGAITAEDAEHYKELGYDTSNVGENVGRAGVELSYETQLHGEWGRVVYEVNSAGYVVREISRTEPVNGMDIQLSIDLDTQQYAERVLQTRLRIMRNWMAPNPIVKKPDGTRQRMSLVQSPNGVHYSAPAGSVTVMNYQTGQVIAMASYPNFDNRWFGAGIGKTKFDQLFVHKLDNGRDDPDQASLTNRAVQGQYNLGSSFKPFVAYSAMMSHIIDPGWGYNDQGIYTSTSIEDDVCASGVKCTWRNSVCGNGRPCTYEYIDTTGALAVSSDVFFYALGEMFFTQNGFQHELLSQWVRTFGFGAKTGIDLPYEFAGRVPTNANKAELVADGVLADGEEPYLLLGDVINMSIGQGLLAATPIQVAVAYSALANGGTVLRPRVVQAIWEPNTPASTTIGYGDFTGRTVVTPTVPEGHQIPMPDDVRNEIVNGLIDNVRGRGRNGHTTTAGEAFQMEYNDAPWTMPVAGKTGTAQGAASFPWNDSSVFAGFSIDPERPYTVVAYLEKSGYGSQGGVPVVKCMFMALSDRSRMDPAVIAPQLDLDSDHPAEPEPGVDTSCMARTDMNNVTPVPPQQNIAVD